MMVLITYDVNTEDAAGRRRLRQIAKQCVNYGQRVQNSVFECLLNAAQCKQLQHKLCSIMDESVDSLRFYYLGDKYHTRIEHFGAKAGYDAKGALIIQQYWVRSRSAQTVPAPSHPPKNRKYVKVSKFCFIFSLFRCAFWPIKNSFVPFVQI